MGIEITSLSNKQKLLLILSLNGFQFKERNQELWRAYEILPSDKKSQSLNQILKKLLTVSISASSSAPSSTSSKVISSSSPSPPMLTGSLILAAKGNKRINKGYK